jgi:hypothetical protein
MHFIVEILFTIIWWVCFFRYCGSITNYPLYCDVLKRAVFVSVKDKYSKVTKWWAEHGVIFSPF